MSTRLAATSTSLGLSATRMPESGASFGSANHHGRGDINHAGRDYVNVYSAAGESLPIPRQLPSRSGEFVNRVEHLTRLDTLLGPENPATRTVAIVGTAGVGKTELVLQWAHDAQESYPDGSLFVNLLGYASESPIEAFEALDTLLRSFNIPPDRIPTSQAGRESLYRALLAQRRLLIVLDNAASPHQIRPLLPGAGSCNVLITSRNQLTGLSIRDGITTIDVDVLPAEEAVSLLTRLVGRRAAEDDKATAALARLCAYLPLALRIVAERTRLQPDLSLAEIVTELSASTDRLSLLDGDEDDELASLRGVFSWSFQSLRPAVAEMFVFLGLHPGPGISVGAAAALIGSDFGDARRRLDSLRSAHLTDLAGPGRYEMHDLLKAYARERAAFDIQPIHAREAGRREASWYLRAINAADEILHPQRRRVPLDDAAPLPPPPVFAGLTEAVHWCEMERLNCVAIVRQLSEEGQHDLAWRLPLALTTYFHLRWYLADWAETASIGFNSARLVGDTFAMAWSLMSMGGAKEEAARWPAALECYERSIPLWRACGDSWGETLGLQNTGNAYRAVGRLDESVVYGDAALALARKIGNRMLIGVSFHLLGETYAKMGRNDKARACLTSALDAFQESDSPHPTGQALRVLANFHRDVGQSAEALVRYDEALAIQRRIGDQHGEGCTLLELGKTEHRIGRLVEAQTALRAAREIFLALGETDLQEEAEELLGGIGNG
jgi:tetratricopeptide (TPR) repeat protein